jgi:hypothetical protein
MILSASSCFQRVRNRGPCIRNGLPGVLFFPELNPADELIPECRTIIGYGSWRSGYCWSDSGGVAADGRTYLFTPDYQAVCTDARRVAGYELGGRLFPLGVINDTDVSRGYNFTREYPVGVGTAVVGKVKQIAGRQIVQQGKSKFVLAVVEDVTARVAEVCGVAVLPRQYCIGIVNDAAVEVIFNDILVVAVDREIDGYLYVNFWYGDIWRRVSGCGTGAS